MWQTDTGGNRSRRFYSLDNLHLFDVDGYLIWAAMLAFYKDPEKWVTGAYVKIGYFDQSDADLRY